MGSIDLNLTQDLVPLIGVRELHRSEPEGSVRWQEGLIKQLTVGEPISVKVLVRPSRITAVAGLFRRVYRQMRSALLRAIGRVPTTCESGTALSGDPVDRVEPCCREGESQ